MCVYDCWQIYSRAMAWFKVALTIGKSSRELKKILAIQIFDSGSISLAVVLSRVLFKRYTFWRVLNERVGRFRRRLQEIQYDTIKCQKRMESWYKGLKSYDGKMIVSLSISAKVSFANNLSLVSH